MDMVGKGKDPMDREVQPCREIETKCGSYSPHEAVKMC